MEIGVLIIRNLRAIENGAPYNIRKNGEVTTGILAQMRGHISVSKRDLSGCSPRRVGIRCVG